MEFLESKKGRDFFLPCVNVFLETKDGRRSFWFAEKGARNVYFFFDIERVGSEMMDYRWGGYSDDMYTPHDW